VKNIEPFIKQIQSVNLQNEDHSGSLVVVSLFPNVSVDEVLHVTRNKLSKEPSLPERSPLQAEDSVKLLAICLRTTHFQFEEKFSQQKVGMALGNSLSLLASNIFMGNLEEIPLDTADHKPSKWLRYIDDTCFGNVNQ
jgi:hypothetical protein